jgi:hypothetical protein
MTKLVAPIDQHGNVSVYYGEKEVKYEHLTKEVQKRIEKRRKSLMKHFWAGEYKETGISQFFKPQYRDLYEENVENTKKKEIEEAIKLLKGEGYKIIKDNK